MISTHTIEITLAWAGGASSTLVASWLKDWLSTKTHSYYEARKSHRDDIRQNVLEPLRNGVQTRYTIFDHSFVWKPKQYNVLASSREAPATFGLVLNCIDPAPEVEVTLDVALFDDARSTHYATVIGSWEIFKTVWAQQYLRRHLQFIEAVGSKILSESELPEHPPPNFMGPYIMHLSLATLVYDRLMRQGDGALSIKKELDDCVLDYKSATVARGSNAKMEEVIQLVDQAIEDNRELALDLKRGEEEIMNQRASLLRQLSVAIASNKLHGRCSLVRFL